MFWRDLSSHTVERGLSERYRSPDQAKQKGGVWRGGGRPFSFFVSALPARGGGVLVFTAGVSSQPTSRVQSSLMPKPGLSFFTLMLADPHGGWLHQCACRRIKSSVKKKQKKNKNKNKNPVPGLCLEYMFMFIQKGAFLKELPPRAVTSLQGNKNKTEKRQTQKLVFGFCVSLQSHKNVKKK